MSYGNVAYSAKLDAMPSTASVNGDLIRKLRTGRELSQAQLAVAAGVGLASVQRAERSAPQVGLGVAHKIARVLAVDVHQIYEDDSTRARAYEHDDEPPEWAIRLEQQNAEILEKLDRVYRAMKSGR